ncbi:ABC transporter ATP-binding protein [Mailhella massiliensis]|uniref:ATP-binding cassette domain-containing protein n=1 Tax=Mailhella massiliensis TaxID=1903261 RepID=A0A921AUH0_9BACT|nr:oligopeptide/dipeptide ABC transporter ATP-binding protein [Mailhella massiliensis]HJD96130.1 ATP-binding cassette domain-containing protein [Mailhella massiliensis]
MDALLELIQVSREFSVRRGFFDPRPASVKAVDKVSLALFPGETLGLVGESGCGKSTLARLATGLLSPSSGEVLLSGRPLREWTAFEKASRIQMIFQDPFSSLDPRQTVGSSIAEPFVLAAKASGRSLSRRESREKVQDILSRVGLQPEHIDRYPHEFSGGQRQRVAVARAIVAGPGVMVCDEPVSALDASVQAQVLNLLKDMQENMGLAYLFISHDLGVIGFMSDKVAVMYLGRVVETAPCRELFAHAAHPYTEALMAAAPSRDPALRGRTALLSGEMPSPLSPPPGCAFHPRCPYAKPLCREEEPPLVSVNQGHAVRCHFPL